jgi:hypothetical protein
MAVVASRAPGFNVSYSIGLIVDLRHPVARDFATLALPAASITGTEAVALTTGTEVVTLANALAQWGITLPVVKEIVQKRRQPDCLAMIAVAGKGTKELIFCSADTTFKRIWPAPQ